MSTTSKKIEIPYAIQRGIRRYKAEYQAAITKLVAAKLAESGGTLRPEEIGECAANVIFGEDKLADRQEKAIEATSLKAYHSGKFQYLDDLVAGWRRELQGSDS
jgi:hypothetical protein